MNNEAGWTDREFRLQLFGGPRLQRGDTPVRISPQELSLVALVASAGRRGMGRDELLDYLWMSGSHTTLRPRLAQILHMARQKLGCPGAIVDAGRRLVLSNEYFSTDLEEFEDALDGGRFEEAISLLSLGFLSQLRGTETHAMAQWLEDRHVQLRAQARRELSRALQEAQDQADFARLAELCSLQLKLDPEDEATLRRLMKAHLALGKPGVADARFREFCDSCRSGNPDWEAGEETKAILTAAHDPAADGVDGTCDTVGTEGPHHRLIGRDREWAIIRSAVWEANGDRDKIITVSGGHGVGKTYLCERTLASLEYDGITVLRAYTSCPDTTYPYDIISQLTAVIPSGLRDAASPAEDPLVPYPSCDRNGDGGQSRHQWFTRLLAVTISTSSRCVIFVDDIDQADEHSLRVLEWVLRSRRGGGLRLLATVSGTDSSPPKLRRILQTSCHHVPVRLLPLDGHSAAEYLATLTASSTAGVTSELRGRAGGLPRVLSAICTTGTGHHSLVSSEELPESVMAAIERVLQVAPRHTRQLLALLAVKSFPWSLHSIQECLSLGLMPTIRALEFLSSIGVVSSQASRIHLTTEIFGDFARLSSSHGLPLTRRQCASYLERCTQKPDILVEAWDLAGDSGQTIRYARDASVLSVLKGDLHLNVAHLRRGMRHARDTADEAEFQSLLGSALLSARQLNEALPLLRSAAASAWALGDPKQWIELQMKLIDAEGHLSGTDASVSAARLYDLVDRGIQHGCVQSGSRALDRALHYYHRAGDDRGAASVFKKAEEMLSWTTDREAVACLHATLAMKAYFDNAPSGLKHAALAVRAAGDALPASERLHVLNRRLAVLLATGRLRSQEGQATIREAVQLADGTADLLQRAHLRINIAVWEADCGNWASSARQLEALIPVVRAPDDKRALVLALCNLGLALLRCARFVEASEALQEGDSLLSNWDSQEVRGQFAAGLGWVALERGRLREARQRIADLDSLSLPTSTDISVIALFQAHYFRRCRQLDSATRVLTRAIAETKKRFPVHHIGLVCERERIIPPSMHLASWHDDKVEAYQNAQALNLHEWARALSKFIRA